MEEAIYGMAAYVCDKICRHREDNSLNQDSLDNICEGCKISEHVGCVLEEHIRVTENKSEEKSYLWKDRMMGRFLRIN